MPCPVVFVGSLRTWVLEMDKDVSKSWMFKPNCSLTPAQLAWLYLSIVIVTLGISLGFYSMGLWMVLPFAGIELTVVAVAFIVYARHAGDYEKIVIQHREVSVTVVNANKTKTYNLNPCWTRVSLDTKPRVLIKLESGEFNVVLGRFIDDLTKEKLVFELRRALALAAV